MIEMHVTFSDVAEAEKLAREALEQRLAACVNIHESVRSLYRWQGKIEDETEILAVFKTANAMAGELQQFLTSHHSYDTPAIIRLAPATANTDYERWIESETGKP